MCACVSACVCMTIMDNTGLMVLLIISTNDSISDVDYEQKNNFSKRLAQYWADGSTYNIDKRFYILF